MAVLGSAQPDGVPQAAPVEAEATVAARARMVREQIAARGIKDVRVLEALGRVPRHEFLPSSQRLRAYEDGPVPIGEGQTMSQPYIVAFMSAALELKPTDRVLEIGTGSGYQAAVLAELAAEVFTIENVEGLAWRAEGDLKRLGYGRVKVRVGDGYLGWPEAAPFDAIIVTCAPERVPEALVQQLKVGGKMIIPVGPQNGDQELYLLRKHKAGMETKAVLPVRFVPMVKGL
ncbi:protein-L-isoaspartate(D-aspartate) O-methyltransferase [Geothrix sp. PMB-07]|uniref:protein-L-isoaspartate(D-aspartate) O-methyltransferase n=1 Tax=Geothrix sp. PMB-07 TaxID=3068640 RepID=UPI002741A58C|nr:protein-L-isoaspartate(D-aspartate) O-methyltransferase [Geothrix sp. PMB-07]WLT30770.1 protein-L-isoaspartate(D-aspartate) O-methyltransferase [Geothrix sp. PMB-07]